MAGVIGKAQIAHHRAEFLGEAHIIEHRRALALQMCRHRHHRRRGDNAGAANPGDHQIIRLGERRQHRLRQPHATRDDRRRIGDLRPPLGPFHGNEAGAEAVEAGEILVAIRLINLPLAPELRLLRHHAEAVGRHRAIAAALADQIVDHREFRRIRQLAPLAAAALFGGTGLLVDQHRHTLHLAQLTLHGVEFGARMQRGADGEVPHVKFLRHIRDQRDALHPLGPHGLRDAVHRDRAIHRLPAGHRHRIVEQDFVCDVGLGRDGLPDRQRAGMIIRAVPQILEHVAMAGVARGGRPVHALAAHLDHPRGGAIHPIGHEVTANPRQRLGALRHAGGAVMRAAGTEIRRTIARGHGDQLHRCAQNRLRTGFEIEFRKHTGEASGDDRHQQARREFAGPRHQIGPGLIRLARHVARLGTGDVVEMLLQLALDQRALLLDDEDFLLAANEAQRIACGERPDEANLVDIDAEPATFRLIQPEQPQRLHGVQMCLAGGDEAESGVRHVIDPAINRVGIGKGQHRLLLGNQPRLNLRAGQIGPANMQAGRRRGELRGDEITRLRQLKRSSGFHRLGDCLEPHPHSRKAREGIAVFAIFQILGHRRRMQDRNEERHEGDIGLMRHRGRHTAMVVARHHQHAAMWAGAIGIAVLERIARAINAHALAVPHAEHAIDGALGVAFHLLRAEQSGGGEVFIDGGEEIHVVLAQQRTRPPRLAIDSGHWRSAISGDHPRSVQPGQPIPPRLIEHDAHQRLRSGQKHPPALARIAVLQPIGFLHQAIVERNIHCHFPFPTEEVYAHFAQ